jgi:3'-5' exoribonuclease
MTQIRQFAVGDDISGFYLVKQLEVRQTKATPPKDFFDILLADKSGEISCKMWDITASDKVRFAPMQIVFINGQVQSYQDKLQLKITHMRPATADDGYTIRDFIRSAPEPSEDLVAYIKHRVNHIWHPMIKSIVEYCMNKAGGRLEHFPAAKSNHHNYYGGLVYHICRMLAISHFVCGERPFLNEDLLTAGIILHDLAKVEEFISENGIVSDYSVKGKLIGHISLASLWIAEAAAANDIPDDDEVVLALQHMVLSHHNLGEWGSPVQPQIPEAVALHFIDQLDAKLQAVEDAFAQLPDGEKWTPRIPMLEGKALYRLDLNKGPF